MTRSPPPMDEQERRFRDIFRAAHADHLRCAADEWLMDPCRDAADRPVDRPLVWSRRNGPWRRVPILWVGAAPGNAGGLGTSDLGAHGTRIPFGGDIAGANLDVLLSSIGTDRNHIFIVAALNQLPARGGGEPAVREMAAPVGTLPDSVALLRDTVIATGPALIIALGNVALRALAAALTRPDDAPPGAARAFGTLRLPGLRRLGRAGLRRNEAVPWPHTDLPRDAGFDRAWLDAWATSPDFHVLPVLHPSAQNMSPYARRETLFHTRMLKTRDALRRAVRSRPGIVPPRERAPIAAHDTGIYALPEWQQRVAARHAELDERWRAQGV